MQRIDVASLGTTYRGLDVLGLDEPRTAAAGRHRRYLRLRCPRCGEEKSTEAGRVARGEAGGCRVPGCRPGSRPVGPRSRRYERPPAGPPIPPEDPPPPLPPPPGLVPVGALAHSARRLHAAAIFADQLRAKAGGQAPPRKPGDGPDIAMAPGTGLGAIVAGYLAEWRAGRNPLARGGVAMGGGGGDEDDGAGE